MWQGVFSVYCSLSGVVAASKLVGGGVVRLSSIVCGWSGEESRNNQLKKRGGKKI